MWRSFVLALAIILLLGAASVCRSAEKKIDPDDVSLAGVVVQPSGNPAAAAEVWLLTASMRGEPLVYDHARTGFHSRDSMLATLMLTDPLRAVEAVERFDRDQTDPLTRAQLAALLTLEGDALWRKLLDMTALWSIDVEDL